jgi:hypothetical protein
MRAGGFGIPVLTIAFGVVLLQGCSSVFKGYDGPARDRAELAIIRTANSEFSSPMGARPTTLHIVKVDGHDLFHPGFLGVQSVYDIVEVLPGPHSIAIGCTAFVGTMQESARSERNYYKSYVTFIQFTAMAGETYRPRWEWVGVDHKPTNPDFPGFQILLNEK